MKNKPKLTNKRKIITVVAAGLIVIVAGTVVYAASRNKESSTELVYKETTVERGNLVSGVTESGSVSIGTVEQTLEISESTTSTSSSSSSSSSGSSSSSSSTSSSAGAGSSGGASSMGTASSGGTGMSSTSSSTVSSTSSVSLEVEEVYVTTGQVVSTGDVLLKFTEDSIEDYRSQLEDNVTSATLALKEAKLDAQSQKISANYTYDSNVAAGSIAQSEYDATIASLQSAVDQAQSALDSSAAKIADYQSRQSAGEDVSSALASEQSNYTSLQSKLTKAQNEYTTKSIQAKQDYDEAMLNYSNASSILSIDTNGINDDVDDAQEELDTAKDALSDFESLIGDGSVYSEYDGTVMSVGYAAGDTFSEDTAIATFADASSVTMTVSVSQEDITAVTIGDTVNIALTPYEDETFPGTVLSMDTTSSSDSSTVSYSVVVSFTGDISRVYADMTGEVTFITKEVSDVIYVSNKAIINEGTTSYVDIKDTAGTITRKEVTTGFSNSVYVEISSGLEEGETALIESRVSE